MHKARALLGDRFIWGFGVACLLLGCAGVSGFPYKWYAPRFVHYDGTLLGDQPAHDQNAEVCEPTPQDQNPCVVMLSPEFFQLKQDYEDLQNNLNACQKKR